MRIVRPGTVVGPQQQYMYLKQLEWVKWGALDEMRKIQAASAIAASTLVTPATPPAEMDEDVDASQTTPKVVEHHMPVALPPVTPSRHIATAAAKANIIAPPGQPRKTPVTKRLAQDSDEDGEDDALPSLAAPPARNKIKPSKTTTTRGITASEQRPTRVTRSTAGASVIRKAGTGAATALAPASSGKSPAKGPNKIPRLATTRTTSAAKALAAATAGNAAATSSQLPPKTWSTRRTMHPPGSPVPSRLPTLIPLKRPHHGHTTSLSEVVTAATLQRADGSDAWMTNNAAAVVVPETRSGRPGLRSVRRRRSSFSAADVVA